MHQFCKLGGHTREVNSCTFSSKYFVTCSGDKSIRVFSIGTFQELSYSPVKVFQYGVNHVTFDSSGEILSAVGTDGKAHLFTLSDQEAKTLVVFRHSDTNTVQVSCFSPASDYLVTGSADGSIALWSILRKKQIKEIAGHAEGMIHAAAFTPCSSYLVTGSTLGDLRVWSMHNDQMQPTMQTKAHEDGISSCGVSCVVFSPAFHSSLEDPNRSYLMASCGHDNLIKLWIFELSRRCIRQFQVLAGHHGPVSSCSFSASGKYLASSSFDKTVILWDPILCEQVYVLDGHDSFVTSVTYSRNDEYLASTSYDKTVIVWNIAEEEALPVMPYEKIAQPASPDLISLDPVQQPQVAQPTAPEVQTPTVPYQQWTCEDVTSWLTDDLCLGQYARVFAENEIDGAELSSLTTEILQNDIGIAPFGHRNKILRAIKNLNNGPSKPAGNIDLQSLMQALPPSLQQLAPTVIQHFKQNADAPKQASQADPAAAGQWQNVARPRDVQVRNVRQAKEQAEKDIPDEYLCPISREIMKEPVIAADGFSYEKECIKSWFQKGRKLSPMTNKSLPSTNLIPNQTLKTIIGQYLESKQSPAFVEATVD